MFLPFISANNERRERKLVKKIKEIGINKGINGKGKGWRKLEAQIAFLDFNLHGKAFNEKKWMVCVGNGQ